MYAYKLVRKASKTRRVRRTAAPTAEDLDEYEYYVTIASLTLSA